MSSDSVEMSAVAISAVNYLHLGHGQDESYLQIDVDSAATGFIFNIVSFSNVVFIFNIDFFLGGGHCPHNFFVE